MPGPIDRLPDPADLTAAIQGERACESPDRFFCSADEDQRLQLAAAADLQTPVVLLGGLADRGLR
jgi:hypothetical protein